jgi:acetoin utilization deacetylase AcuC-like enzyme
MTYDHEVSRLHRADLDREIDSLRTERLLAADVPVHPGVVERARRRTGRVLIAAGRSLAGPDGAGLEARRA